MGDFNSGLTYSLPGSGRLMTVMSLAVVILAVVEIPAWFFRLNVSATGDLLYVPMAPGIALRFIILGLMQIWEPGRSQGRVYSIGYISVLVLVMISGLLEILSYWEPVKFDLDQILFSNYLDGDDAATAMMSALAAIFFVLLSGAVLCRFVCFSFERAPSWLSDVSGLLSSIVSFGGFVILLGYVYGTPFLCGIGTIPMAAPSAAGFLLLGVVALSRLKPDDFPHRYFAGSPLQRRLVQAFVPLVFFAMLLQATITRAARQFLPMDEVLLSALLASTLAILAVAATSRIATVIGGTVDKAETALRNSEDQYRAVFDNSALGIVMVDSSGRFTSANIALQNMLGYTWEDLQKLTVFDITHPEDMDESHLGHNGTVTGELSTYRMEKRYIKKDGTPIWVDLSVSPIKDAKRGFVGNVGVIADISERKQAEDTQRLLATAVEQSIESVVITDMERTVQYLNPAFERVSGYERKYMLGNTTNLLRSDAHDASFYKEIDATLSNGKPWKGRVVSKRRDGTLYHEDVTISPVRDASGRITNYVDVRQDVTQQVHLERQLIQAQKMEAIGTMAGGIAHDFNNLLQVILGYSDLLLENPPDNPEQHRDLQAIRKTAARGADLVKQILTFSRNVETHPQTVNLNEEIGHARQLLTRIIPKMIEIRLSLAEGLKAINADPVQIEQVLLNLAVNAYHAMPKGGSILIETKNVMLDQDYCASHLNTNPGAYVMLSVSDTGHGMEKALAEHIFEPFFTTKKTGEGTGLGLAMVFGIVKGHSGNIECYSEPGKGTTFRIYLPAIEEHVEETQTSEERVLKSGGETILLVDDEELILDLGGRVLSKAGYSVLTASRGRDAVELYRSKWDNIDLIILDLVMPSMGGAECLDELLAINPDAKVLIASGYSPDRVACEIKGKNRVLGFIEKPYRPKAMLTMIHNFLISPDE